MSVAGRTVVLMPRPDHASGHLCPEAEHVNDLIRRLMDEPATSDRAARYVLLLDAWDAVTRDPGQEEPRAA